MAIQSAWLLTDELIRAGPDADNAVSNGIGRRYEAQFQTNFASRMRWASLVATLAMRPQLSAPAMMAFERMPGLLDFGARWAGKTRVVRAAC
jgi:hypothetical protein